MPDSLLTALKLIFLGVLYLFFIRVLRAVWVELREPKSVQVAVAAPAPRPARESRAPSAGNAPERLVVLEPADQYGQSFELGDELTVGRAIGCGIALPDDTFVSTLHARVFRRDGALFVEDLGSTNGTFVNDHPVTGTVAFHKGDRLQVGKSVLELSR
jgi:pSer/pThr/pTyr-binding forkhead associated (FHA) protein